LNDDTLDGDSDVGSGRLITIQGNEGV
jgi:hypothetical protein